MRRRGRGPPARAGRRKLGLRGRPPCCQIRLVVVSDFAMSAPRRLKLDRRQAIWVLLLFLAQVDDVITTSFGMARGTVEGNPALAGMVMGGSSIIGFWSVKLVVTVCMLSVVVLVNHYRAGRPGKESDRLRTVCLVGNQVAVIALTGVAINNLLVALL